MAVAVAAGIVPVNAVDVSVAGVELEVAFALTRLALGKPDES